MTPASAQAALFAFDATLTAMEHLARLIAEARKEGLITVEEQTARLAQVDDIRARVGLPKPPA